MYYDGSERRRERERGGGERDGNGSRIWKEGGAAEERGGEACQEEGRQERGIEEYGWGSEVASFFGGRKESWRWRQLF